MSKFNILGKLLAGLGHGRRVQKELEFLLEQFMNSEAALLPEDLARVHSIRLEIVREREARVRSIQTLLGLKYPDTAAAAFRELVQLSQEWPSRDSSELLPVLGDFLFRKFGDLRAIWPYKQT